MGHPACCYGHPPQLSQTCNTASLAPFQLTMLLWHMSNGYFGYFPAIKASRLAAGQKQPKQIVHIESEVEQNNSKCLIISVQATNIFPRFNILSWIRMTNFPRQGMPKTESLNQISPGSPTWVFHLITSGGFLSPFVSFFFVWLSSLKLDHKAKNKRCNRAWPTYDITEHNLASHT